MPEMPSTEAVANLLPENMPEMPSREAVANLLPENMPEMPSTEAVTNLLPDAPEIPNAGQLGETISESANAVLSSISSGTPDAPTEEAAQAPLEEVKEAEA